jgi:hypothetical protein
MGKRQSADTKLIIIEGYQGICTTYPINEGTLIFYKIV